jgi:hypothetical protein
MTRQPYEPPALIEIGLVHELTLVGNKIGLNADIFTPATGGQIVGDIVPPVS